MKKLKLKTKYGFIEYSYIELLNIVVFRGSYIEYEYRNNGHFKEMVKELFKQFPIGTKVQVAIANELIVDFFKRLDFYPIDKVIYWGAPENCVLLEGVITESTFDKI